ncbi:MAG TPA: V4R domain-containing protein [Thermoplasmata archaeon]
MKFVKLSQSEYEEIRKLYEGVMSQACYGLFFREGMILGEDIAKIAMQEPEKYFEVCANLLRARGWVDNIVFQESTAVAEGAIEASRSESPTCHRLRGIVRRIYETKGHRKYHCEEIECAGKGDKHCVFKVEALGGE